MITIVIQAEDNLATALQEIASRNETTLEAVAKEALTSYLQAQLRQYSFIGLGRSGKGDLSLQAEKILQDAIDRREGWSLSP